MDKVPTRDINDKLNCICERCLSKIYAYDFTCRKAREQEAELQKLLYATERLYTHRPYKSIAVEADAAQTDVVLVDDSDSGDETSNDSQVNDQTNDDSDETEKEHDEIEVMPEVDPISKVPTTAKRAADPAETAETAEFSNADKKNKPIVVHVVKCVPTLATQPTDGLQQSASAKPQLDQTTPETPENWVCQYCDLSFFDDKNLQVNANIA